MQVCRRRRRKDTLEEKIRPTAILTKPTLPRWTSHMTRIVVTLAPTSVLGLLIRDRLTLLIDCTNCTAGGGAAEGNGTASGGTDSEGWHPRWCLGDGLVLACRCCWHDWCLHGCCNRSCWCYSIQPAGMQSIHAELHYSSLCFIHATCCNLTLLRGVSFFSADSKTNKPASN